MFQKSFNLNDKDKNDVFYKMAVIIFTLSNNPAI